MNVRQTDLSKLSVYVKVDENSPSGLVWAEDRWRGDRHQILACSKGSVAGHRRQGGYWVVKINEVIYQNHRIVCSLSGIDTPPDKDVDHIDGNPSNNMLSNLRVVPAKVNSHNQGISVNNRSGKVGVYWHVDSKRPDCVYATAAYNDINGKQKIKYFSVKKLGIMQAWRDACCYRDAMILELNKLGAHYTMRHGY